MTISKKVKASNCKDRGKRTIYEYTFEKEGCVNCPFRDECIQKAKTKEKRLQAGENSGEYYEHSQFVKTEGFTEEYKKRSACEWKNAEMKRFHGLARAKGYGLPSVTLQAKLTALAVNLKRIATILSSENYNILLVWGKSGMTIFKIRKFGFLQLEAA